MLMMLCLQMGGGSLSACSSDIYNHVAFEHLFEIAQILRSLVHESVVTMCRQRLEWTKFLRGTSSTLALFVHDDLSELRISVALKLMMQV